MAIEPDNTSIRPSSAGTRKTGGKANASPREVLLPPARAHVNFIPSAESLATLIRSAVAALKNGVFWDRGTILNLLV